jgi:hypothetical protein
MGLLKNRSFLILLSITLPTLLLLLLLYLLLILLGAILGLLTFFLLLFFLFRHLLQFLLFPGGSRTWRYWWQSSLEIELANNFIDHLHELSYILDLLEKSSNLLHIKKNSKQLQESLEIFKVLHSSYTHISNNDLTSKQRIFKQKLSSILEKLSETNLIFLHKSEDLLSVLSHSQDFDWSNVTFEDFPENILLKQGQQLFLELEQFVLQFTEFHFPWSLLQEGLFTNLNVLRLILQSSVRCEQHWVSSEGVEIDCVIVRNEENQVDAPVVIFCNPNGGLYEYACYQNNWLEFYISQGIDFCMWNYRGYGRTRGKVSSRNMVDDVQAIFDFLSKFKMYNKIAVHGESIGAVPACALARQSEVVFLFADRTFSSIDSVSKGHLRLLTHLSVSACLKCCIQWSDSTCQNFLLSNCYKVLSFDPKDEIVPESASLKAGISNRLNCNELDRESLEEFLKALQQINNCVEALRNNEVLKAETLKGSFSLVSKENEPVDEEIVVGVAFKIFKCMEIDSAGVTLYDVKNLETLARWVKGLQIWGSLLPIGSNPLGREKGIQKVKATIAVLQEVFRENEFRVNSTIVSLCRQARLLKNAFTKVLKCLENFSRSATEELSIRDDDQFDSGQGGYLIPINCGHSGKYSNEEKSLLTFHLKQSKMIS